ncbi:hypothetical protein FH972_009553 [Carpinus fangiana]|uniref:PUM-HD domain-containing protein n=1 Tax=Carpinus fangiana TaxID=176857 RepID=A0A660KMK8_9ROSI|nr:hypothetical protein FH972_009553 [Carpinus fangiana]
MEFDEFERLLGEIPNVTSAKPHSEESGPKTVSLNGNLSPICVNSCEGPIIEKLQNYGSLDEEKISVNKIKQSSIKRFQLEEMNLPDDQSLTSAFAGLNFTGGVAVGAASLLEKSKSLPTHTILFDRQCLNSLKKPNYVDSQRTIASSFKSAKGVPCGFDEFSGTKVGQESLNLFKLNAEETKKRKGDYFQQLENFSTSVPFAPAVQGFQFLSNVPVRGVQFPAMPDQQQFFLDARSLLPYFHQEQINQPQISWRNVEEEQYYRMHQHYQYLQQLHSQGFEAQHAIQPHGNLTARQMSESPRQPYFEVPISHQIEKSKQEPFWNNYTNYRGSNQSNSSIPFTNFNAMQILDEVTKQKFPESYSARSHGVNTLKDVKFDSVGGNESLSHINQIGNFLSNHHLPRAGCFQLDSLRSWGLSHETKDLKSIDMKTRAVQKVIETLKTPEQFSMVVSALKPGIVTLIKNTYGNHVAQCCLQCLMPEYNKFLFEAATTNCVELATDRHGCCVLQKCLSHCDGEQRRRLICEITSNSLILSQDPFGNYVVQLVFDLRLPWATEDILDRLEGHYAELSIQKFSSHVVEKCLKYAGDEDRTRLIQELIENPRLDQIMQDPYGNYVVQAALNQSKGAFHTALLAAIKRHDPVLQTSPYGKKVLSSSGLKK